MFSKNVFNNNFTMPKNIFCDRVPLRAWDPGTPPTMNSQFSLYVVQSLILMIEFVRYVGDQTAFIAMQFYSALYDKMSERIPM